MRASMKNNNGFVLIVALLCMVVLFILGPIFMTLSMTETQIAFNDKNATRALYVAEMAVERARRDIKYDADFDLGGITNQYFASPTPIAAGMPIDCSATITWQGVPPQQRCYDLGGPIPAEPDASITVDDQAYRELRDGRLDPQSAFLDGQIRVEGDMQLAMQLALAAIAPD